MKILSLGSLNLDYVYAIPHFVKAGETLASTTRNIFCGGKGLNQSIALARAGAQVYHAGKIGSDGIVLREQLTKSGVDTSFIHVVHVPTGHAIIQVDPSGQNCIIIYGGANQSISHEDIDAVLENFDSGDILLLQNEISSRDYAIKSASEKGMLVALNPSPMDQSLKSSAALQLVHWFILNEIEGHGLTGEILPENICHKMRTIYHNSIIVLTLGSNGVMYYDGNKTYSHGIYQVDTVDTTAAGDTFAGYFLACTAAGYAPEECLQIACKASAIAVSKPGASDSIPTMEEVINTQLFLK